MAQAYLIVVGCTYFGFAVVFLLLLWETKGRFLMGFTVAWLLETVRVAILIWEPGSSVYGREWYLFLDALYLPVTWALVYSATELTKTDIPRSWTITYFTASGAALLGTYLLWQPLIETGWAVEQVNFYVTLADLTILMIPGGIARLYLAAAFYRYWKETELPGALLAFLFAVPHALASMAVPFKWYFSFFPTADNLFWFLEIFGLSIAALIFVLSRQLHELRQAMSKIKVLQGLLPVCAGCKKVRDDRGYWNEITSYIHTHSEAEFSHGLCPKCRDELYPEYKEVHSESRPVGSPESQ